MGKPSGRSVKAKSIEAAERKNRSLEQRHQTLESYIDRITRERRLVETHCVLLAKLAADGPAFYNPLEIFEAKRIRDAYLFREGLDRDGSPIEPTKADT